MRGISWFISICTGNGLTLTEKQAEKFEQYRQLLLFRNQQLNLISRKDEENFYSNHALNSISFLFKKKLKADAEIIDLGTGGGLPGIPIKILYPNLKLVMLDSIAKKTGALSEIVNEMALENARVVTGRAEELAKTREFEARFDYVISRAAGKLDDVVKWSRRFLGEFESYGSETVPSGTLIVLKGGKFEDELKHTKSSKFVDAVEVDEITFNGMDEIDNKEKKLVLVKYKDATQPIRRKN